MEAQEQPRRSSEVGPAVAREALRWPGRPWGSKGAPRSSHRDPGAAREPQEQPGRPRSSHGGPGAARDAQEQLRRQRSSQG